MWRGNYGDSAFSTAPEERKIIYMTSIMEVIIAGCKKLPGGAEFSSGEALLEVLSLRDNINL